MSTIGEPVGRITMRRSGSTIKCEGAPADAVRSACCGIAGIRTSGVLAIFTPYNAAAADKLARNLRAAGYYVNW